MSQYECWVAKPLNQTPVNTKKNIKYSWNHICMSLDVKRKNKKGLSEKALKVNLNLFFFLGGGLFKEN